MNKGFDLLENLLILALGIAIGVWVQPRGFFDSREPPVQQRLK